MRKVTMAIVAALIVATVQAQPNNLKETADKALKTKKLQKWERAWYEKIANGTITPKQTTVWQTQYGSFEGYKGDFYHIACNKLPRGTVVYLPSTNRIHVVTNRGASFNDGIARRHGGQYWIDVWVKKLGTYGFHTKTGKMYILGKAPGW